MPGKITVKENGPYVCQGIRTMVGADGVPLRIEDGTALCRCGRSATKPYCDGTHNRVGVRQPVAAKVEPSGKDKARPYEGREALVLWNDRVCTHARNCVRTSAAFDPGKRPWIRPDDDTLDRVRAAVRACPSGALRIAEAGEEPHHLIQEDRAEIVVEKDGSYWITGPELEGYGVAGEGATPARMTLCRCGLSANKPFCDGSHSTEAWVARDEH